MNQLSAGNSTKQPINLVAESLEMERSLKGLLMDKGKAGLETKFRQLQRKMELIQQAMSELVEHQRFSRENAGCDCLDLYLVLNLKTGRDRLAVEKIKQLSSEEILLNHSRGAVSLEWRARKGFAFTYGYPNTARITAFNPKTYQYEQVREYVAKTSPDYYPVMAGYDAVKISLNYAMKIVRKSLLDLHGVMQETAYPEDIEREAEMMSRRIFKGLPESEKVAHVLNQLYGG